MSTRTLFAGLVMSMVLAALALPAAAQSFGLVLYCDARTLQNCTDTTDATTAGDAFGCEGTVGDTASCTNQRSGEVSPYCVLMGHVSGTNRDSYLCGTAPTGQ
jgi:hypothetical protein